jgi:hypothetical protein
LISFRKSFASLTRCEELKQNLDLDNLNGAQLYDHWYRLTIDSIVLAGGRVTDESGNLLMKGNRPWWGELCKKAVEDRKRSFREFLRDPSSKNLRIYRSISNETRKIIASRKKENFKRLVDDISRVPGSRKFWETIKKFKNSSVFKPVCPSDTSKFSIIEEYMSRLVPPTVGERLDSPKESMEGRGLSGMFSSPFGVLEIIEIIKRGKINSSPGCDLIGWNILRLLPESAIEILKDCYNKLIKDGSFPKIWKEYLSYYSYP